MQEPSLGNSSPPDATSQLGVRIDLTSQVRELVRGELLARWFAGIWLASFLVLGLVYPRVDPAIAPFGNWLIPLAVFAGFGTLGIWVWLGTSTFNPVTDMTVDSQGILVHDRKGREYRYEWSDRRLRIRLWRYLDNGDAPLRQHRARWYLSVGPPRSSGRVTEVCYEMLTDQAGAVGLTVKDSKSSRRTRHSVSWTGETRIHH
ncbi:MAG: hypothetical protein L3K04_03725 [Thermoplasmata archaeon]|nr:hypothetical protein [Thermoplasmata archaeon]MCI4337881.1 hypothetical protein [Thermoplasmata archaeon]MCI4341334.1 hypothetical protein [Thermoplasmata archaeon]